jgi:hypothetical protein
VAVVVVVNVWREVALRREAETTIRLAIEKGQQLDPAIVERLLRTEKKRGPDGLLVVGGVTLAAGLGLPIMGNFMPGPGFRLLLGVGALVSMIGLALLILSFVVGGRRGENGPGAS